MQLVPSDTQLLLQLHSLCPALGMPGSPYQKSAPGESLWLPTAGANGPERTWRPFLRSGSTKCSNRPGFTHRSCPSFLSWCLVKERIEMALSQALGSTLSLRYVTASQQTKAR